MDQSSATGVPLDSKTDAVAGRTRHGTNQSTDDVGQSLWPPMPRTPMFVDSPEEAHEDNPVSGREFASWLLIVTLCDLTIYRGEGFAGLALLFVLGPALLWCGVSQRKLDASAWVVGPMLLLSAVRMLWCGSWLNIVVGFPLLAAFAMSLSGMRPYLPNLLAFGVRSMFFGFGGVPAYYRALDRGLPSILRVNWAAVGLPMIALGLFGGLFLAANPDMWTSFTNLLSHYFFNMAHWLGDFFPSSTEVMFWGLVGCLTIGWFRPFVVASDKDHAVEHVVLDNDDTRSTEPAPLFEAFRNTLLAVIALFAFYLAFEFLTLWFRVFPRGFHYSGYAHQGAAWLTVALALATLVLSIIFRGAILNDSRLSGLRRLAWVWSVENMILALAVYHRLLIYVGFNGMTRMRMVAFFGMSAVVIGFLLVLLKIARTHNFTWLIRRHLWAVSAAIFLYSITPIDGLVMQYNVRRIVAGDLAPAVQIGYHDIDSEGLLCLSPLVESREEIIREGIKALLADRHEAAEKEALRRNGLNWTTYQIADQRLLDQLRRESHAWSEYTDQTHRKTALDRFREYVYRWY